MRAKNYYDQIRWIDNGGKELVRVDFNHGKPAATAEFNLQDKADRYYVKESLKLEKDEIYTSAFDLNREKGVIELPYKPILRIATPIYDSNRVKQGILILNILGDTLLQHYAGVKTGPQNRRWLINNQGYFLRGPDSSVEWGFMLGKHENSMEHIYPQAWQRILATQQGQFEDQQGLWSFNTVFPAKTIRTSLHSETIPPRLSSVTTETNENYWKLVRLLPKDELYEENRRFGQQIGGLTLLILIGLWIATVRVVKTNQKKLAIEKHNHQLTRIVNESTDFIGTSNTAGELTFHNRAALLMVGLPEDYDISKLTINDMHPDWAAEKVLKEGLPEAIKHGSWRTENVLKHRDGHEIPVSQTIIAHYDEQGQPVLLSTIMRDISDIKKKEKQLIAEKEKTEAAAMELSELNLELQSEVGQKNLAEDRLSKLAHYDFLTNLPNRLYLNDYFMNEILPHKDAPSTFIFFDVDNFRSINDKLGHSMGDGILVEIGIYLQTHLEPYGVVGRVGGDEFVAILKLGKAEVDEVLKNACADFNAAITITDQHDLHLSVGIALYPDDAQEFSDLLMLADKAMFYAKKRTDQKCFAYYNKKLMLN